MRKRIYFILLALACFLFNSCKTSYIYECDCTGKPFKVKYDYIPPQRADVSDEEYKGGINILEQIYSEYKFQEKYPDAKKEFSMVSPRNIAIAYAAMQEPKEKIFCLLCMEEEKGIEDQARYFKDYDTQRNPFKFTQSEIDSLMDRYRPYFDQIPEQQTSLGSTIGTENTFDQSLVDLMKSIVNQDQKFRSEDTDHYMENVIQQTEIDSINLVKIDSLYTQYGSYVGRSLVSESNEYAMWTVIQHAPLEKQEYYLPIVQKAVENFELKEGPFIMLIDRIYYKKYGYQIFGSQFGIDLGSKRQIKKAKKKFNLDG